jgi:hypothetical protein
MKVRQQLLLLLLMVCLTLIVPEKIYNITLPTIEVKATKQIKFNRFNLGEELPEYVLVAITNHECDTTTEITERIFMMEAVWNRVQDNYGNHGLTLSDQLLSPKQFTGLFIYRSSQFSIDFNNPRTKHLIELAREIIYNHKRIYPEKRIYYWAGICDSDGSHGKWVKKKKIKTLIPTKNIFA